MKTVIYEVDQDEFTAIKKDVKSYLLVRGVFTKGQRIILQSPDNETEITVTHVQTEPGLMKNHCILSFASPTPVVEFVFPDDLDKIVPFDDRELHKDFGKPQWSDAELANIKEQTKVLEKGHVLQNNEGKPDIIV